MRCLAGPLKAGFSHRPRCCRRAGTPGTQLLPLIVQTGQLLPPAFRLSHTKMTVNIITKNAFGAHGVKQPNPKVFSPRTKIYLGAKSLIGYIACDTEKLAQKIKNLHSSLKKRIGSCCA